MHVVVSVDTTASLSFLVRTRHGSRRDSSFFLFIPFFSHDLLEFNSIRREEKRKQTELRCDKKTGCSQECISKENTCGREQNSM